MDWSAAFADALPYAAFLDKYANPNQRARWDAMHGRVRLDEAQTQLLQGFVRKMSVLILNGAWCGDCINQVPIFDHFARATPAIDLRLLDRDARREVREALAINGGHRVPVAVFLSEDWREVARYGERTLSRYRELAAQQLGPACPTGLVAPSDDATRLVIKEWLAEFERAQLLLRLSPRLRELHGD
jgi:thiol-disulfide isomerase/thioredoxin